MHQFSGFTEQSGDDFLNLPGMGGYKKYADKSLSGGFGKVGGGII